MRCSKSFIVEWRKAFFLVRAELTARFRRTLLGPVWKFLSVGVGIFLVGFFWARLHGTDPFDFLAYFFTGFLVWQIFIGCINSIAGSLINHSAAILSAYGDASFYIRVAFLRTVVEIVPLLFFWIIFLSISGHVSLLSTLIFSLFFLGMLKIIYDFSYFLAHLSVRYRDVPILIGIASPIIFLLSPVLFRVEKSSELYPFLQLNPVTIFLSLTRDQLLGPVGVTVYELLAFSLMILLAGSLAFYAKRNLSKHSNLFL
jgi:ABC-type polysaccharide/polyol phosphate export permease